MTQAVVARQYPYIIDQARIQDPPNNFSGKLKFLGLGMITSAAVVGSGVLFRHDAGRAGRVHPAVAGAGVNPPQGVGADRAGPLGDLDRPAGGLWLQRGTTKIFNSVDGVSLAAAVGAVSDWPGQCDQRRSVRFLRLVSHRRSILDTVHRGVGGNLGTATEFAWNLSEIGEGMRFQIAAGSFGVALAMFGLTGVGAGEITSYTYWRVEKGYAAWTGPRDDSAEWASRANGWISVMKIDAWLAWVIYTISTIAFYILGTAVLHPQNLDPQGREVRPR